MTVPAGAASAIIFATSVFQYLWRAGGLAACLPARNSSRLESTPIAYKTVAEQVSASLPASVLGALEMRHLRTVRHRRLIEEVAAARKAAGMSQRALAERLKRSDSYISKFEAGERRLEVCEFIELCEVIGADPAQLISRIHRR